MLLCAVPWVGGKGEVWGSISLGVRAVTGGRAKTSGGWERGQGTGMQRHELARSTEPQGGGYSTAPAPRGITRTTFLLSISPELAKASPAGFLLWPVKPSSVAVIVFFPDAQVLDVSGANLLASAIPDCHVSILENCGHSVVVERPRKTANLMLEFLALLHSTGNSKKQA